MRDRAITALAAMLVVGAWCPRSAGATPVPIEAPVGGRSFSLPSGVVCEVPGSAWSKDDDARFLRPPSSPSEVGKTTSVRVAESTEACDKHGWLQPLVVTAPWPVLEPNEIVAWIDEGRLEARGRNLKGATLRWQAGARAGEGVCLSPIDKGDQELCSLALDKHVQIVPNRMTVDWWPAGAVRAPGAIFFDRDGHQAPRERFRLRVGRTVIGSPLRTADSVDLADGVGRVPLEHPEVVAGVDCGPFRCAPVNDWLRVLPSSTPIAFVTILLRLVPGVFVAGDGGLRSSVSVRLPVVRCPLVIASGHPLRHPDGARVILRVGARCERIANRLRWRANGGAVEVLRVARDRGDTYVVLDVGRIDGDRVSVSASHEEFASGIVAAVVSPTMAAPRPVVTLEIPGQGIVDFIPRNQEALVHLVGDDGHLSLLPVDGLYRVRRDESGTYVQAEPDAEGMVSLRFGYRAFGLPPGLASFNLAVVTEAGARSIQDACLPLALIPACLASWQAVACGSSPRPPSRWACKSRTLFARRGSLLPSEARLQRERGHEGGQDDHHDQR